MFGTYGTYEISISEWRHAWDHWSIGASSEMSECGGAYRPTMDRLLELPIDCVEGGEGE